MSMLPPVIGVCRFGIREFVVDLGFVQGAVAEEFLALLLFSYIADVAVKSLQRAVGQPALPIQIGLGGISHGLAGDKAA